MAEFAKYAFNKSHAAAYAVVAYQTAYLKAYYKEEFMAATLNSFLGNLDKIPEYIDECKKMNIEILKPDINKSFTKFTVDNGKIRFGLGSIKNVGIAAIENIVKEREKNGPYKDLIDFCERIQGETVNKKCIECLIKAGTFDDFKETRKTLLASFEGIINTIINEGKRSLKGQVTMFDLGNNEEKLEEIKYNYIKLSEFSERELLSMEKEMLGLYISGHPLESVRPELERQTNINTLKIIKINEGEEELYKDGQNVKYGGIITSVKKKYTKNNNIMAFVTIEDLYGSLEIIVFESCYNRVSNILMEDNIVIVDGRLSIREDEEVKIVANNIRELKKEEGRKTLNIDISNMSDEQKQKLKGAIKFFNGEKNNIEILIKDGEEIKRSGNIYLTLEILEELKKIVGKEKVEVK